MKIIKNKIISILFVFCCFSIPPNLEADITIDASVNIDNVGGKWSAKDFSTEHWGRNNDPQFPIGVDYLFDISSFDNHSNLEGPGLEGARLVVNLDLQVDGIHLDNIQFVYDFEPNKNKKHDPCHEGSVSFADDISSILPTGEGSEGAQVLVNMNVSFDKSKMEELQLLNDYLHDQKDSQKGQADLCDPGKNPSEHEPMIITGSFPMASTFVVGNHQYTLPLPGFQNSGGNGGGSVGGFGFSQSDAISAIPPTGDPASSPPQVVITPGQVQTPEPSTYLFLGSALLLGLWVHHRKKVSSKS
jgi:hypothetical protein